MIEHESELLALRTRVDSMERAKNDYATIAFERGQEIERLKAALQQVLWHYGSDQDRRAILDAGKGWKTDTFELIALVRTLAACTTETKAT